jgi:hypothetical protein
MEKEELVLLATVISYRSCRLDPTPGGSATTGISNESSSAFGPIPLSLSSWGVLKLPAEMITSRDAWKEPDPFGEPATYVVVVL